MGNPFLERIAAGEILIADGAMGDLKEAIIKQAEDDTFAPHGND